MANSDRYRTLSLWGRPLFMPHFRHWLTPAASQFLVKPIIEALSLHADCGLRRVSSASMALAKL